VYSVVLIFLRRLIIASLVKLTVTSLGCFDAGSSVLSKLVLVNTKNLNCSNFELCILKKSVASYLANSVSLAKFCSFLLKTKVDELPRLIDTL
jgi:lipopolysaccharide/colanic/teichoic acid biosynthesis glycosyltransferase